MPQNAVLLYSILEQGPWQDKKVLKKKAVTLLVHLPLRHCQGLGRGGDLEP